jgi:hypothetical protein
LSNFLKKGEQFFSLLRVQNFIHPKMQKFFLSQIGSNNEGIFKANYLIPGAE